MWDSACQSTGASLLHLPFLLDAMSVCPGIGEFCIPMLKKRIIPCLDVRDGRTVKGVRFQDIRDAGDPVALGARYAQQGADELVYLDITATHEKRKTMVELVRAVARGVYIPFTVGGGIDSEEDVRALLEAGADKVSVNSAAVRRPALLSELARPFGRQCIVLAIDARREGRGHRVYVRGGREATSWDAVAWAREGERLGAGEILLTSMDADGTGAGFDLQLTQAVAQAVNLPVIASGGGGEAPQFETLFRQTDAAAALAASIFHFDTLPLPRLKAWLAARQIPIRT
jgi:cyclase